MPLTFDIVQKSFKKCWISNVLVYYLDDDSTGDIGSILDRDSTSNDLCDDDCDW